MKAKAFLLIDRTRNNTGRYRPEVADIFPDGAVIFHDRREAGPYAMPASVFDGRQIRLSLPPYMTIAAAKMFFLENLTLFNAVLSGWGIDADSGKGALSEDAAKAYERLQYTASIFDVRP